mmetsp:Transcript_11183/g.20345  ORF Transcript_11183/g.20345 Transcript_11183/m.20345 type:complete len:808 (+) Transcript_11183:37-2460(+)
MEPYEFKALEGKLVEVQALPDVSEVESYDGKAIVLEDLTGSHGRVLQYVDASRCLVETFDGLHLGIPEKYLEEYEPPEPEEGGFDILWPDAASGSMGHGIFASMVAECLVQKGYCLIQLSHDSAFRAQVAEYLSDLPNEQLLPLDFEQEYLGNDSNEKIMWWPYIEKAGSEADLTLEQRSFNEFGSYGSMDGLEPQFQCDRLMTNLGMLMWPLAPEFPDERVPFVAWGRTNPMVRCTMSGKEEKKKLLQQIRDFEDEDMEKHTQFVDQKRLCMMHFLEVGGGSLILTPKGRAEYMDTNLPVQPNRLLVFRCDDFVPTYMPKGRSVVLQSWLLDAPQEAKHLELKQREIEGPKEPVGEITHVMSLSTRYAGISYEPLGYSTMFMSGSDCEMQVPLTRWDIEIYYREEHTIGYSMTKHGAMMDDITIAAFDNKFFGISAEESVRMAPHQRICLEVGYETLASAGLVRSDLHGRYVGCFVGDSGTDFDNLGLVITDRTYYGKLNSITCSRLGHIMGLRGPTFTAETACSSSLVATGMAKSALRSKQEDLNQNTLNITAGLSETVVIGTNTLIGPGAYITLSGPGMLTSLGRCFTFDESADGFARGEGIGGMFMRKTSDPGEAVGSWGMLVGACVNQDGRSASLTAPHGPSQQQCIMASMGEGGFGVDEVSIAECHGTGTALGDPIEVGAIRNLMTKRTMPIMLTSSKSNIGHGEAAAGMAGLIKCVLMLNAQAGMPNCHLRHINPHLDVAGFPVYFDTELQDFCTNTGVSGVSSFGFGGTNARADIWGSAHYGPHACLTGVMERQLELIF